MQHTIKLNWWVSIVFIGFTFDEFMVLWLKLNSSFAMLGPNNLYGFNSLINPQIRFLCRINNHRICNILMINIEP